MDGLRIYSAECIQEWPQVSEFCCRMVKELENFEDLMMGLLQFFASAILESFTWGNAASKTFQHLDRFGFKDLLPLRRQHAVTVFLSTSTVA